MEKKFKVENLAQYGSAGTDYYYTFDEAKIAFREKILSPDGGSCIVDLINNYAKEHYPENTPAAFGQLADIITKLLTDSNYPQNADDVVLEDFEDENIEFFMDSLSKVINCYVNHDEYDGKFPLAEINIINMNDEAGAYYFFLTEKRNGLCWSKNVNLSLVDGEDANDDFDDFDDFDGFDDFGI